MEELVNNATAASVPEPSPKKNAGWFKPGDPRVNREGRPRGSKAPTAEPAIRAPRANGVMLLWVPQEETRHRLTSSCGPWIATLPEDYEIVESHVDAGRDALVWSFAQGH
jgi:hypothetical protein